MRKFFILFFVLIITILSGCAPRYMDRKPSPHSRRKMVRKSETRIREVERTNRDLQFRKMINQIRFYLGTPYKYGGDSKRGMDCSGFVYRIFRESYNFTLPHNASQQYLRSRKISSQQMSIGDLVFFSINRNGNISHVGIYLGKSNFAHASTSLGVTISKLTERYYQSRFVGAGRILE